MPAVLYFVFIKTQLFHSLLIDIQGKFHWDDWAISDIGLLPPYIPGNEKWKAGVRYYKAGKLVGGYDTYASLTKILD